MRNLTLQPMSMNEDEAPLPYDDSLPPAPAIPQAAQPVADPVAQPASTPNQNDLVAAYIQSKLTPNAEAPPDQALISAQRTDKLNDIGSSLSRQFDAANGSFLSGISNFSSHPQGASAFIPAGSGEKQPSQVQAYMAAKKAQQDAQKNETASLKDVAEAQDKLSEGKYKQAMAAQLADPNSIRARELGIKQENADTKKGGLDESVRFHDMEEHLKRMGMTANQARLEVQKARLAQGAERLGLQEGKFNNQLAGSVVPGVEFKTPGSVTAKNAGEVGKSLQAADKVTALVDEIKGLKDSAGYESFPLSEKRARLRAALTELQPQLTMSGGMGNFTVGHQHLVHDMLMNPDSFLSTLNTGANDAVLDELAKRAHENVAAQANRTPGGGGARLTGDSKAQRASEFNRNTHKVEVPTIQKKGNDGKTYEQRADGKWYPAQ